MHGMEDLNIVYHFNSDSCPSMLPIISNSIRQAAVAWF